MKKVKLFLKRHFKANPLSYLGWLGILGVLGIFFVPTFIPFLLCFSFFSYYSVVADELFWRNVNRASGRAFWSVFTLDVVMIVLMFIRGMTIGRQYPYHPVVFEGEIVTMGAFSYEQYVFAFLTFLGNIVIMLLVFTVSMMRFKKQEKRMLEEE